MLYPESNECRMVTSLDGFWNFKVEDQQIDSAQPLPSPITMAVPASFNDQVIDQQIRNHDGYFWYQTTFNVSKMQLAQLKCPTIVRQRTNDCEALFVWLNIIPN